MEEGPEASRGMQKAGGVAETIVCRTMEHRPKAANSSNLAGPRKSYPQA